jgi:hypothetical protein
MIASESDYQAATAAVAALRMDEESGHTATRARPACEVVRHGGVGGRQRRRPDHGANGYSDEYSVGLLS